MGDRDLCWCCWFYVVSFLWLISILAWNLYYPPPQLDCSDLYLNLVSHFCSIQRNYFSVARMCSCAWQVIDKKHDRSRSVQEIWFSIHPRNFCYSCDRTYHASQRNQCEISHFLASVGHPRCGQLTAVKTVYRGLRTWPIEFTFFF